MSWKNILKQEELEIFWDSKDGKASAEVFYAGYWGILSFHHDGEERKGLGEK